MEGGQRGERKKTEREKVGVNSHKKGNKEKFSVLYC